MTSNSQKAKGPAEAATSPSHGSNNPHKDIQNVQTDIIDPASPATVAISTVGEILEDVKASGAKTVEQQLNVLFDKFNLAVRAIDPSITAAWVGYDTARPKTPTYIVFERPGSEFFGRSA